MIQQYIAQVAYKYTNTPIPPSLASLTWFYDFFTCNFLKK